MEVPLQLAYPLPPPSPLSNPLKVTNRNPHVFCVEAVITHWSTASCLKHRDKSIWILFWEFVFVACIKVTLANTVARDSPVHCVPNSTQVPYTLSEQNKRQRKKRKVTQQEQRTPQLLCSRHIGASTQDNVLSVVPVRAEAVKGHSFH